MNAPKDDVYFVFIEKVKGVVIGDRKGSGASVELVAGTEETVKTF